MDQNEPEMNSFDMSSLQHNLPQNRRGLSRYYSGKARSFTCLADVQCLEDLKKKENPEAKKRKLKNLNKKDVRHNDVPSYPCRRVSSSTHCATSYVH
ncbi:hypothetical protein KPL70_022849 [Citrus sinensis]|uniref:Uncharacterized protein n=2 Tax=Citrus TaxID=2706 RepID=A0A067E2K1_CITSI|nr:hypothetical protein CICLE_v10029664mg [Citrus x clementina]KAH9656880.1 hypothetical protein KPL70_022849 [Citrus sinensis]KDO49454.1 hypothetical protein CISIN_1g046963mg [Citrus sinensis]